MRRPPRFNLGFDALDSKTLLSLTLPGEPPRPPAEIQISSARSVLPLQGTLRGRYGVEVSNLNAEQASFRLTGSGRMSRIGAVQFQSRVDNISLNNESTPESILLTISNRRGNVVVRMTPDSGGIPGGNRPFTIRLTYSIVSGTGSFANSTGQGTVDFTMRPQLRALGMAGSVAMSFRPTRI